VKSLRHDGVWWAPEEPTQKRVGILRFNGIDGARLELIVPADKPDVFPELVSYDRLFGLTTDGKAITLMHSYERSSRGTLGTTPRPIEIYANQVIVGSHCSSTDPLVSTVSARFRHLNEWYGRSGLSRDAAVKPPNFSAQYSRPAPVVLHDNGSMRVLLRSGMSGAIGAHDAHIRERIHIDVVAATPTPFSELYRVVQACGDLLSIACLDLCDARELTLTFPATDTDRQPYAHFHAVPIYKEHSTRKRGPAFLFRYEDIQDVAPAMFEAWLSQIDKLHSARVLYFAGAYGGGFLETKLLALTQAAEAFHRRFYPPGLFIDPSSFEAQVRRPLTAAIPAFLEPSFRQSLKSRLKFANELSLRRRMRDLVRDHSDALKTLVECPPDWIGPIVDHRNEFTHFPIPGESEETSEPDPERLLRYNFFMRLLLEACFLHALRLQTDRIAHLISQCDTYRKVKERFFSSASPDNKA
jgi:ApeA N-terminal domain 1/Apea-like HEPN